MARLQIVRRWPFPIFQVSGLRRLQLASEPIQVSDGRALKTRLHTTTRFLSPATIATHYFAAATNAPGYSALIQASNPLLYFHLNEPGDPPATNVVGTTGTTGAYSAGTTPGQAGPRPSAYSGFEAANNSVLVSGGSSVAIPGLNLNTNTVTISGWVKASTDIEDIAGGIVVCDTGTTYAGLTIDGVSGGLGIGYVWNNDPNTYNWSPTGDLGFQTLPSSADNQWAYVALVVQPTQAAVYICASNNPASFAGVTNFLNHVNQSFSGTTLFGSDAGTYNFAGNIDEVAIFNRSLGVGELYSQYATAVGGLAPKSLMTHSLRHFLVATL